tara:strand:- start:1150 stop:1356 length:207 start_codon:yes stop_codon:yes gene_type:complete
VSNPVDAPACNDVATGRRKVAFLFGGQDGCRFFSVEAKWVRKQNERKQNERKQNGSGLFDDDLTDAPK